MTERQLIAARLAAQHLTSPLSTPAAVVRSMTAMQAQDFYMSLLALSLRCEGKPEKVINAFNRGTILRTHALRPTWQLVSPANIRWLLQISAPNIRRAAALRHKQLKISSSTIDRSLQVIEKALRDGERTRDELVAALKEAGLRTDENRASHLLMEAEVEALICSGTINGRGHHYDLLSRRVKAVKAIPDAEALKRLALSYFTSRGPATVSDFTWWSGLAASQVKTAMKEALPELKEIAFNGKLHFMSRRMRSHTIPPVLLLPAYDEWLISYKDRSAMISVADHKRTVSVNGIFWPIVLMKGKVSGTWKGGRVIMYSGKPGTGTRSKLNTTVELLKHISAK